MAQVYHIPSLYNLLANSDCLDIRNARLFSEVCSEKTRSYKFQKGKFQLERRQKKITASVVGEGSGAGYLERLWDFSSLEVFKT